MTRINDQAGYDCGTHKVVFIYRREQPWIMHVPCSLVSCELVHWQPPRTQSRSPCCGRRLGAASPSPQRHQTTSKTASHVVVARQRARGCADPIVTITAILSRPCRHRSPYHGARECGWCRQNKPNSGSQRVAIATGVRGVKPGRFLAKGESRSRALKDNGPLTVASPSRRPVFCSVSL